MAENDKMNGWAIAGAVTLGACWAVTLAGAVAASGVLLFGMLGANGAPQEAAIAALAVALVAIPYVFTRAIEGLVAPRK